jgi:hypothetical protein
MVSNKKIFSASMVVQFLSVLFVRVYFGFLRAVFTKSIVTPVLGISGVGGAMAIYGASDVVVSETINFTSTLSCKNACC